MIKITTFCNINVIVQLIRSSYKEARPRTALCSLYGPLLNSEKSETSSLISRNVLQIAFRQNSKGCRDLFRIGDDRDNHDYHSSEILSDGRKIDIIALAKKLAIIAIITSTRSDNRISRK
jgi:hypothetical protein